MSLWDKNIDSDPVADLRAWAKMIAEQPPELVPEKHWFYGMRHLRRFFEGESYCAHCLMRLDPGSKTYVTCHPDDFDHAMKLAWEHQVVIKPHSFVPRGKIFLVREPEDL